MAEKKATKKTTERTRNWTFVVYPESAPENWRDILEDLHIQWVESPLHDKDLNADGEVKKAHWHIMVMFEGNKSFEQIKLITDSLNAPIPQKVASAKSLVRYMAHLDNPDKTQYLISDIKSYGGVDLAELLKPTSSDRYVLIGEMMDFVEENDIIEIKDLFMYARQHRFEDWFPLLCDNSAYIMGAVIKSRRHSRKVDSRKVDFETGEILEGGENHENSE